MAKVAADTATATHHAAAEQVFNELYAEHWKRLYWVIRTRMNREHAHLAEDITQETYIRLWNFLVQGNEVQGETGFGLLVVMARTSISRFYEVMVSRENVIDFADPENYLAVAKGSGYAAGQPENAPLARELDEAMEDMAAASEQWRAQHKVAAKIRSILESNQLTEQTLTPEGEKRLVNDLAQADAEQANKLEIFRRATYRVGQLRVELERAAGSSWRCSAGGLPPAHEAPITKGSYRRDLSVTHCPEGHHLTVENTYFEFDGARKCRICRRATMQVAARRRAGGKPARLAKVRLVSDDALAAARALLLDPGKDALTLEDIVAETGVSESTIRTRLPDAVVARRERIAASGVPRRRKRRKLALAS